MLNEVQSQRVYLASEAMDLRKSIDGLAVIVQQCFNLDPFSSSLFVFCNKHRNKVKILEWSHCGFWLHYLRLEKGKFQWPASHGADTIRIDLRQLRWLLDGLSTSQRQAQIIESAKNEVKLADMFCQFNLVLKRFFNFRLQNRTVYRLGWILSP